MVGSVGGHRGHPDRVDDGRHGAVNRVGERTESDLATERAGSYACSCLFAASPLYPLLTILTGPGSRRAPSVAGGLGNFADAWRIGRFGDYLKNSVIVSATVVAAGDGAVSSWPATPRHDARSSGRTRSFYLLLLGLMVPTEAIVIPLYFDSLTGADAHVRAIVLPQVAQSIAFGTFWMRTYFRSSSREVVEAARLDGAGTPGTLWHVLCRWAAPRC